tara:strand:- start:170594 stop:171160 length:567 start_codon:yes stop_codon:yes gene_type:complete
MSKAILDKKVKEALPSIISKVQGGDAEARNEFAVLLLPYIKKLIAKYRPTLDDEVESLSGAIIMKLLDKIHTIDLSKSPIGFITRTAINAAIDQHRKYKVNKVHNTVEYQAFRDYDTSYHVSGMCTDTVEGAENLLKDFLCEDDAEIVSKFYLHNMSLEDIAQETGYEIKDIEHTIDYARRNISRALI